MGYTARQNRGGNDMVEGSSAPAYAMDNAWQEERQRLARLEELYDAGTIRHLDALGVAEGWRSWDVGAGGGSIVAWLCDRVGASSRVLATDLDTRFLEAIDAPNLAVRQHDIVADPLPDERFDLIHTRLLLTHLPEREALIHRLAGALAPGGWLVVEEFDITDPNVDPRLGTERTALALRVAKAFLAYMDARRGGEGRECGRRLHGWLLDAGLIEVGAEGRVFMHRGGPDGGIGSPLRHPQVRAAVAAMGTVTEEEIEAYMALGQDPDLLSMSNILMAAWGRRAPANAME
jgi:2-polyprenyl-3-methyl-5-hydroxy-6-metoxy-1,4-benzoquinol methylase